MENNKHTDHESSPATDNQSSINQLALRVGTEFFSGILAGLFLGYGIDHFLGTKPWGMVGMILLGFAAGFRNIFKLFSLGQAPTNPVKLNHNGDDPHEDKSQADLPSKKSEKSELDEGKHHG